MSKPIQPRLPLAPLLEIVGGESLLDAARRMNIAQPTLHRWQRQGIPLEHCDPLACRFGSHPLVVWGPAWGRAERAWEAFHALRRERDRARRQAYQQTLKVTV